MVRCEKYFDILNRYIGVDHKCDGQRDRQTKSPLATAQSNIVKCALKTLRDRKAYSPKLGLITESRHIRESSRPLKRITQAHHAVSRRKALELT